MDSKRIQQKESRGQSSLVTKLSFLELGRRFWLLVSTDILIAALFFAGMLLYCDNTAKSLNLNEPYGNLAAADFTLTGSAGPTPGFTIPREIAVYFEQTGIVRNVWLSELHSGRPFRSLQSLKYSIALPTLTANMYCVVTFTLYGAVSAFYSVFGILLAVEALGLLLSIGKIHRSIRRSLRPIYDLTLAAYNINRSANPTVALPDSQELYLSGAIDTLNTITENDLDRRIVISDEREELRGLAQAINAMLDRLDAAYRSQLRFVSDASHELRTPIAVIQGYANLLDRWGKTDEATLQESIDAIKAEAAGMQDLVEQLLFLARSDNRSIVLNVEAVDVCELAGEVLRETQMIDPNHEFVSNLTGGLTIRGDLQLLKQAMRIFVDNAIKYTPRGGRITIATSQEKDSIRVAVSDNGVGIPADDLERVFDRFFRSDESRTRGTGGTGLGLSIAKWIVDRHGGYVELVSREDIGTRVTFVLPVYVAG